MEQNGSTFRPGSADGRIPKALVWVFVPIILLGVIFLIVAAVNLVKVLRERDTFAVTEGTIIELYGESPIVSYEVEGQAYTFRSHFYSSDMRVGQSMRVKYPLSDPSAGRAADGDNVLIIVFGACGLGFTAIPLIILLAIRKREKQLADERAERQYESAPYESLETPVPETEEEEKKVPLYAKIFRNLFFYLGLGLLGLAAVFLIVKLIDWENKSFIPVFVLAAIGAVHTGIGYLFRKMFE